MLMCFKKAFTGLHLIQYPCETLSLMFCMHTQEIVKNTSSYFIGRARASILKFALREVSLACRHIPLQLVAAMLSKHYLIQGIIIRGDVTSPIKHGFDRLSSLCVAGAVQLGSRSTQ